MPRHRALPIILSLVATFPQVADAQQRPSSTKAPASSRTAQPQPPRITIEPKEPHGGSLVRVTIDRLARNGDSVISAIGEMAGEPLRFLPAGAGRFQAIGAVPVGASDSVVALATVARASGAADTLRLSLMYPHNPPPLGFSASRGRAAGARRLSVDRRFTQRLDTATEARVERENELARNVGKNAQLTPPQWTFPFLRPRDARVTSRFGTGRVFNGRVTSSHLGIDYRGAVGETIRAANRGIVALVAEFFLAGNVVYLDHGAGLVTGYFHMSETRVAVGDTVERGQEIGLVGSTGRVTGPHLHWTARFGALTVDPAGLLSLGAPFTQRDTIGKKSASAQSSSP